VAKEKHNLAKRARTATGLTQSDFADLIGAHAISVCRWETGAKPLSGSMVSLLKLVEANPNEAARILGGNPG